MTTVLIAVITSVITSALMIWLLAPKPKKDDFSMFDAKLEHNSNGFIPEVKYGSTNPLECQLCNFVGKTAGGLKNHKIRIHGV